MNFRMDLVMPAPREAIWPIFFDVARIASLIPGCEQVEEKEPLALYSAVMKQRIGPFKMEAPAEVRVEELEAPSRLRAHAHGRDKVTGTTMDVVLGVVLHATKDKGTRMVLDSSLDISGRLASLGASAVKKKAEEMFEEFERRLRAELGVPDEDA
jgi:Uncharacterized conserved protein